MSTVSKLSPKAIVKLPSPQEISETLDLKSLKFRNNKFSPTNLQRMGHLKINTKNPTFRKIQRGRVSIHPWRIIPFALRILLKLTDIDTC